MFVCTICAHDAAGHRVSKTEGGVLTRFLYDGERVQAEYDTSWNLQAKYTLEEFREFRGHTT